MQVVKHIQYNIQKAIVGGYVCGGGKTEIVTILRGNLRHLNFHRCILLF